MGHQHELAVFVLAERDPRAADGPFWDPRSTSCSSRAVPPIGMRCTTSERPSGDSAGCSAFQSAGVTALGRPVTDCPDESSCSSQTRSGRCSTRRAIPFPGPAASRPALASLRDAMRSIHYCQAAGIHRNAPDAPNVVRYPDEIEGPSVGRPRQRFAVDHNEPELPHLRLDVVRRWFSDDTGRPGLQCAQMEFARASVQECQTAIWMPPDGGQSHGRDRARCPRHTRQGRAIRRGEIEGCRSECAGPHRDVSPIR